MIRKYSKKVAAVILTICLTLSMLFVSNSPVNAQVKKSGIFLDKSKANMYTGYSLKLKVTTQNIKTKVEWVSSNKKVATVSKSGLVKAISPGKAVITVSSKSPKTKAVCTIVVGSKVKDVSISTAGTLILEPGKSSVIKAKVVPSTSLYKTLSYTSTNKKVATVTKTGVVKAIASGDCKITVKGKSGKSREVTVHVLKDSPSIPSDNTTNDNQDNSQDKPESNTQTKTFTVDPNSNKKFEIRIEGYIFTASDIKNGLYDLENLAGEKTNSAGTITASRDNKRLPWIIKMHTSGNTYEMTVKADSGKITVTGPNLDDNISIKEID